MLAHDAAYLSWRFLFSEGDVDVPECQLSIFWEQQPRAETKRSSHREQKRQWENTDQGEAGAINEVNQIVEHCDIRRMRRETACQRKFACARLQ